MSGETVLPRESWRVLRYEVPIFDPESADGLTRLELRGPIVKLDMRDDAVGVVQLWAIDALPAAVAGKSHALFVVGTGDYFEQPAFHVGTVQAKFPGGWGVWHVFERIER